MKNFKRFENLIKKVKNIVITTHLFPDADGIGSQIALCHALRAMKKNVICVNESTLLERYHYLDAQEDIEESKKFLKKKFPMELLIVLDTNSVERIGSNMTELALRSQEVFFIDHHPAPKEIAALHIIDTTKAATGELVGSIIEKFKIPFTKEISLALYTAIVIDTSCFRYPNVTGSTHKLIGKMLDTGVEPHKAYNKIYGAKKLEHLQLIGQLLLSAQSNENQEIAWIYLTEKLMKKYNVNPEDTHSFINYLLILKNIKVAVMFREVQNRVKISFRSTNVDVGVMARALGGGGHDHSAACFKEGPINIVIKETIDNIKLMLKNC